MTTGETDLATLFRSMRPVLHPEVYVFTTLKPNDKPPPSLAPIMTFREEEGLTLILLESEARTAGLACTFRSRMITLQGHSSLSAVGFLAAIGVRLAEAGLAVNPVSAYFHDHLFVPAERAEETLGDPSIAFDRALRNSLRLLPLTRIASWRGFISFSQACSRSAGPSASNTPRGSRVSCRRS